VQSLAAICCRDERLLRAGCQGEDWLIVLCVSECGIEKIRTAHPVDSVAVEGELSSTDDQQRQVQVRRSYSGQTLDFCRMTVNNLLAVVVPSSILTRVALTGIEAFVDSGQTEGRVCRTPRRAP
jgi:hypothetical protein